jgi:hypothetical protein
MAQREIIEKVASYIAGSSATTEEDFYELQSLLSDGAVKSVSRNEPIQGATKDTPKKLSSEYDSDQIASFFSTELSQLRDDPEFTGSSSQVDYLKEIIAADKMLKSHH